MTEQEWRIRFHSSTESKQIVNLLNATFGDWGDLEKWNWKFNPPLGRPEPIVGVAENRQAQIVGHWSVLPVLMKVGNRVVIGSQAVDAVTHQDFRRMGIFDNLVPFVLNEAMESGVAITYGVAEGFVADAYLRRHGWIHVQNIPNLIRILDYKTVLGMRYRGDFAYNMVKGLLDTYVRVLHRISLPRKRETQSPITVSQVEKFDANIDRVWKRASEGFDIITVRDADYLNWRFADCPDREYGIWIARVDEEEVGYLVTTYSEKDRVGYILDLLVLPEFLPTTQTLLSTAVRFFKMMNASYVQCWMPKFAPYSRHLWLSGFIRARTALKLVCHINSPDLVDLPSKPRWFLTLGDCDII